MVTNLHIYAYQALCTPPNPRVRLLGWESEQSYQKVSHRKGTLYKALIETSPSWLVKQYTCQDEGTAIAEGIRNGITTIVRDGSCDPVE